MSNTYTIEREGRQVEGVQRLNDMMNGCVTWKKDNYDHVIFYYQYLGWEEVEKWELVPACDYKDLLKIMIRRYCPDDYREGAGLCRHEEIQRRPS